MNNAASSERFALIVDDAPANRDFLERLIGLVGYTVKGADSAKSALETASTFPSLDLAVIDMELPDTNGIQLTGQLRVKFPDCLIIVATMHDEHSLMEGVFERGGNIFIVKPHGFMELFKRLQSGEYQSLRLGEYIVIDQYGPRPYTLSSVVKLIG
jgi:two-component system OmpR family response regulator